MTAIPIHPIEPTRRSGGSGAVAFASVSLGLAVLAAVLAGWAPIGFSIVTVFLFAGPHNWIEFRYFLAKMPAHWGPLRGFFVLAIGGVIVLTVAFAMMPALGRARGWGADDWTVAAASWNTALVLWVAVLAWMCGRMRNATRANPAAVPPSGSARPHDPADADRPSRAPASRPSDWSWALPIGFALVAFIWMVPWAWDLALVYLHPLIAMAFLDRELARRRPQWRRAYHACLACVPLMIGVLWWRLADAPPLAGQDMLSMRITRHAGAGALEGVSPHLLVATHTFLEMLHYGVWIVAIPLVGMRLAPWKLQAVPLYRRSRPWRWVVAGTVLLGVAVVLALWGCFLGDYAVTRDIYFTIAIAHVLAEFPFLLRALAV